MYQKKHRIKTIFRDIFSRSCWLAKERFRVSDGPVQKITAQQPKKSNGAMRHEKTVVEGI